MTLIRTVDFETTGLPEDKDKAEICEAGWCDVTVHDGGGVEIGQPVSMLCNPGRPIRPEIRAVHHIRDAELIAAAKPEIAFQRLAAGSPDYFAAHKADFERAFFDHPDFKWICTWKVALRLWPDSPSHSNQTLRYYLGLDLPDDLAMPPHRAGPDAYVTAQILARAIEHGGASIDDMVRWSSGPALLTKVTFGKHKGMLWKDLPRDYLEWIFFKSDMDSDTKANAKFRLKERGEL